MPKDSTNILPHSSEVRSQNGFYGLNSRFWQSCVPSGGSHVECISLLFRSCLHSLAQVPSSIFKLSFFTTSIFLTVTLSPISWLHWAPLVNTVQNIPPNVMSFLVTTAESFLPCKWTLLQVLGMSTKTSQEGHHSVSCNTLVRMASMKRDFLAFLLCTQLTRAVSVSMGRPLCCCEHREAGPSYTDSSPGTLRNI